MPANFSFLKDKPEYSLFSRAAIEAEKKAAIREIRNVAATLSVLVAEKLLCRELDNEQKQSALIEKLISEIPMN